MRDTSRGWRRVRRVSWAMALGSLVGCAGGAAEAPEGDPQPAQQQAQAKPEQGTPAQAKPAKPEMVAEGGTCPMGYDTVAGAEHPVPTNDYWWPNRLDLSIQKTGCL